MGTLKNITKRGDKYHVSIMYQGIRKTGTFDDEEEAKIQRTLLKAEAMSEFKARKDTNVTIKNTNKNNLCVWSLEDAFEKACRVPMPLGWLDTVDLKTVEGRYNCANSYFKGQRGLERCSDINFGHLMDYVVYLQTTKKNSNATVNRKLCTVRKILKIAVEFDQLENLPKFPPELQEPPSPEVTYSKEDKEEIFKEMLKLIEKSHRPDIREKRVKVYHVLICLDETIARVSEILSLKIEDIDFDNDVLRFAGKERKGTKTKDIRFVPMTNRVRETLLDTTKQGELDPFTNISRYYVYKMLKECIKNAGISEGAVHTFRHTGADEIANSDYPIAKLQKILGHRRIETTLRYVKVKETKDFVDKLDQIRNRT